MENKDIAISISDLSKCYRIGQKENVQDTFGGLIFDYIKSPFQNYRKYRSLYNFDDVVGKDGSYQDAPGVLWALKDLSFDIYQGDVLGIIGMNGAGKSTLLKILSRITPPTSGHAEIYGRVSSLLEVGTGFHQELTGRENVYLNGTVLGMTKKEVDRKFDEIVAFSEIEKFLDTPVKRYSSGMRVRLAFAVAAHLEPEILIIDEVLAVGDARFQRKCINKMQDVGGEGRTVLFVSHNMAAITRLCDKAVFISGGKLAMKGSTNDVVSYYLNEGYGTSAMRKWEDKKIAPGGEVARLCSVSIKTADGELSDVFDIRCPVYVEMEYEVIKPDHLLLPNFHFHSEHGVEAFATVDVDPKWRGKKRPCGRYFSVVKIPGNMLAEGMMFVRVALITLEPPVLQFNESDVVAFQVNDSQDGDTARGDFLGVMTGCMRPLLEWDTVYNAS